MQSFGYLADKPSYTSNCKDKEVCTENMSFMTLGLFVSCRSVEMVGGSFYHRVNIERWKMATALWNIGPSQRDKNVV